MKFIISSDSTCDLGDALINKNNIKIVPLNVVLGEDNYFDGKDIKIEDLFAYVEKTGVLPKTAARSIMDYEEHFKNCLKDGDAVVHISLSSELSSSYSNAVIASQNFENVIVIDSLSLSTGQGLLVLKACELASHSNSLDELKKQLLPNIAKIQASFIISNLKYLYKGGRCSAIAAFGANLLKIKPSVHLKNGKMNVGKKYMGKFSDTIIKYTTSLLEENTDIDKNNVFITYTSDQSNCVVEVEKILKENGFINIYHTIAGCTISSHCGPECMGVLFLNK